MVPEGAVECLIKDRDALLPFTTSPPSPGNALPPKADISTISTIETPESGIPRRGGGDPSIYYSADIFVFSPQPLTAPWVNPDTIYRLNA